MTHQEKPPVDYLSLGGHGYSITVLGRNGDRAHLADTTWGELANKATCRVLAGADLSWRKQSPREAKARGKA